MDDRSVHARDIKQSVVVTGSGNYVRLAFGDSGVVLPLRRPQFRPLGRRQAGSDQRPRELDILLADSGKLPFVGRNDMLDHLRAWLESDPDISVHALTGRAGAGKTRLALELCRSVDNDPNAAAPWTAGFLSPLDLAAVVEALVTRDFAWERPTLLVLDYAAQSHKPLARWLDRLAAQSLDTKLRILLLEREAPQEFGWWHELTNPAFQHEHARRDLFNNARPSVLPNLTVLEERRNLMAAALRAAREIRPDAPSVAEVPTSGTDPAFDARLAAPQFGNPLSLVMAGVIALDRGPHAALALRRLDAARQLGRRELKRLTEMAGTDQASQEAMRHIVAFNGLAGGLPRAGLRQTVAAEFTAAHRQADLDTVLDLLTQELPFGDQPEDTAQTPRLSTIQPDLIGEAAIIEALTGSPAREAEAPAVVRRAYALGQDAAAQSLIRLVQDYAHVLEERSAPDAGKAAAHHVLDWLLTLAREVADPSQLIPLASALPVDTVVLREAATVLTARLANFFQQRAVGNGNAADVYLAARWVNNLANRLRDLGQHEVALETEKVAVQLHRTLAELHSGAVDPGLAGSLSSLAGMLTILDRHEEAVEAADEAVRLCRALEQSRPGYSVAELAGSLGNYGNALCEVGRNDAALEATKESVQLYRRLAEANSADFTPELARSLHNLANRLSSSNQHEGALKVAQEAVQLRRVLAEERPDAHTHSLAKSLSNLANRLSTLGRHEEAWQALEEAAKLYRALAGPHPDAFASELASLLISSTLTLSQLSRREEALVTAKEAVALHRTLAKARPDVFVPGLIRALCLLGALCAQVGSLDVAHSTLREGLERLAPLFQAFPASLVSLMPVLVQGYVRCCQALGRQPDMALLAPVPDMMKRLRSEKGEQ